MSSNDEKENVNEAPKTLDEPKKEEKKKGKTKKLNKKLLLIIGIVVGALLVGFGLYYLISKVILTGNAEYPIVYASNDQLILWKNAKDSKFVLETEFDDKYLNIAYGEKNHELIAYTSDESLYIFNAKNGQKEKISSNVSYGSYIKFTMQDKMIIFQDQEESIYSYDLKSKSKNKIASVKDSSERIYIDTILGNKILFYELIKVETTDEDDKKTEKSQYNYYTYDLKTGNKEKIISNFLYARLNNEKTKLAYEIKNDEKTNSLYIYDLATAKSEKIIHDMYLLENVDYDDFSSFVYIQESDEKLLVDDEGENAPVKKVTKKVLCTYSLYLDGKCKYKDWWNDKKVKVVETEDKKVTNKDMLEYADGVKLYDVYVYKNGKSEKIASNILSYYDSSADGEKVVFKRFNELKIFKTSEFNTYDDFKKKLDEYKEKESKVVYQVNGKEYDFELKENTSVYSASLDKGAYVVIYDGGTSKRDLYQVKIENDKVAMSLLDNDVYNIMEETKYGVLYVVNEGSNHTLKLINDNQTKELGSKVDYYYINDEIIYMFDDCSNYSCQYSSYNGEKKALQSDVTDVTRINNNVMYVFKNYSKSKNTCDLYEYKNGKMIQVAFDVGLDTNSIYAIKEAENDYSYSFGR
ncbi:MAG: hypothetical protein IKR57_04005 [Bacilli bacterium]|nr:hypothetical protein [Bacilli bacterium]